MFSPFFSFWARPVSAAALDKRAMLSFREMLGGFRSQRLGQPKYAPIPRKA